MDCTARRRVAIVLAALAVFALLIVSANPTAAHAGETHTTTASADLNSDGIGRVVISLGIGVGAAALAGVGLVLYRRFDGSS